MRRAFAGLIVVALLCIAAPAGAQQGLSAKITGPGNGATLSGSVNVQVEASSSLGVKRLEILIDGLTVASKSWDGVQQNASLSYSWDTTHSTGSSQIAPNGEYTVQVNATGGGGAADSATSTVHVDNAPSTVSGVSAVKQGRTVTVSWSPNPEPDIATYRVERDSGSGFVTAGETKGTEFTETLDYGSHAYRVVAVRSGGRTSAPSSTVGITIAAPEPSIGSGGGGGRNGGGGGGHGPGVKGSTEKGFVLSKSGKKIGIGGLPSYGTVSLAGLSGLPQLPSQDVPWGTYKKKLPYDFPTGVGNEVVFADNVAARSPDSLIPPDGLRWLAAGLLFVTAALFLQFVSRRILVGS
jgi:Bacterial Ig domain